MRRFLLLTTLLGCAAVGCRFQFDRTLSPGELRGRVVLAKTDGTKLPAAGVKVELVGTRISVKSDSNGRFSVRGLPAATYSVRLTSGDAPNTIGVLLTGETISAGNDGLDLGTITLQRLAALQGTVQIAGKPRAGAQVVLPGLGSTLTTADGSFTFNGLLATLPAGPSPVQAFASVDGAMVTGSATYTLTPGQTTKASVTIDPMAKVLPADVSGKAHLVDSQTNAEITAQLYADGQTMPVKSATPDAGGSFRLQGVPAGVYTLVTSANGYQDVSVPFVAVAGQPVTLPELVLTKADATCGLEKGSTTATGTNGVGDACDTPPPPKGPFFSLVSVTPAPGVDFVPTGSNVVAQFSVPPDGMALSTETFSLQDASGTMVPGNVQAQGPAVVFTPAMPLTAGTTYTVHLAAALRAVDGQTLGTDFTSTFKTIDAGAFGVVSTVPAAGAMNVSPSTNVVAQFSMPLDMTTVSSGNVALVDMNGSSVAGDLKTSDVAVIFTPASPLQANTAYTLRLTTGLRSTTGQQLPMDYSATFTTAGSTGFTVTGGMPMPGATGVPTGSIVSLTFSAPVDAVSATTDTVVLQDMSGNTVQGEVSVNDTAVIFTPAMPLQPSTSYNLHVTTGLRSTGGASLAVDYFESFATAAADTFSVLSVSPADGSTGVSIDTMVVIQFNDLLDALSVTNQTVTLVDQRGRSAVFGWQSQGRSLVLTMAQPLVSGSKYTLTLDGSIQSQSGHKLGAPWTSTFSALNSTPFVLVSSDPAVNTTNVSATGPYKLIFSDAINPSVAQDPTAVTIVQAGDTTPVPIQLNVQAGELGITLLNGLHGNTSYVVTLGPTFTAADGRPLTGLNTIPFTTGTAPFTVIRSMPTAKATNVAVNTMITVDFTNAPDPQFLNTDYVQLLVGGNPAEAGYSVQGTQLVIQPMALMGSTDYTIHLSQFLQDVYGQTLGTDVDIPFTTGEPPLAVTLNPPDGSVGIAATAGAMVQFSLPMDASTVIAQNIFITSATVIQTDFSYDAGQQLVTLRAIGGRWNYNTQYTLHVLPGVKSLSGQAVPVEETTTFTTTPQPPTISIAAGSGHSCLVLRDGALWCFGANGYGQLGNGTNVDTLQPQTNSMSWRSVTVGSEHTCALDAVGGLSCWGANYSGQLAADMSIPNALSPQGVIGVWNEVSTGGDHTCGIRQDAPYNGTLWCWGDNTLGESGVNPSGGQSAIYGPLQVDMSTNWVNVSAAEQHACAVKGDGTLWCWGNNVSDQLGSNAGTTQLYTPTQESTLATNWASVSAGAAHTCALKTDQSLWCWGSNQNGELGLNPRPDSTNIATPMQVTSPPNEHFVKVSAGATHTCAVTDQNNLYCWGDNSDGQLGDGTLAGQTSPEHVGTQQWTAVNAGDHHTCAVEAVTGTPHCWGNGTGGINGNGAVGTSAPAPAQVTAPATHWLQLAMGDNHTCGLAQDSTLWCWGKNDLGQLGDGTTTPQELPEQIDQNTDWAAISAGGDTTCGLRTTASGHALWCWGSNNWSQVQNADFGAVTTSPVQVGTREDFAEVWVGSTHTCARYAAGDIDCWGSDAYGQLANGNTTVSGSYNQPAPSHLTGWSSVVTGQYLTCTLDAQGKMSCAGLNDAGQCGTGTAGGNVLTLTALAGMPQVSQASLGSSFGCALTQQGKVLCWGDNSQGQTGLGSTVSSTATPTDVGGSGWSQIGVGQSHACGVQNGRLWCWGSNYHGQIGDPTLLPLGVYSQPTPLQIGTDTTWLHARGGASHSCGVKVDGSLWCWGDNEFGQLGIGHAWEAKPVAISLP